MAQHQTSGSLFVFEGPDGVGKSTIATATCEALITRGINSRLSSFPGRDLGTLGKLVYDLHHVPAQFGIGGLDPAALQTLHIAAHLDAIKGRILPALRNGINILLDRYWWSTWVYGSVSGLDQMLLRHLIDAERVAWDTVVPEVLILVVRERPIDHGDVEIEAWQKLARAYDTLAEEERMAYPVEVLSNEGALRNAVDLATELIISRMTRRVTRKG